MGLFGGNRSDGPMDSRVQRFKARAGRDLCGVQNSGADFNQQRM